MTNAPDAIDIEVRNEAANWRTPRQLELALELLACLCFPCAMSKKGARRKLVSGTVSRPSKANHVETILYEIDMLEYCFGRLREKRWAEEKDYYLCIEGFLLHYRNLIEFFGNHGRGLKAGRPEDWSPGALSADEVASILNASLLRDYGELISRYLSHCNEIRARKDIEWQHIEMYKKVGPLLTNFRKLFPSSPRAARMDEVLARESAATTTTSILSPSILEPDLIAPAPRKPNK